MLLFYSQTRLLTGVGRYNEMTYIFDALHQSHQFELLLGKGTEKVVTVPLLKPLNIQIGLLLPPVNMAQY